MSRRESAIVGRHMRKALEVVKSLTLLEFGASAIPVHSRCQDQTNCWESSMYTQTPRLRSLSGLYASNRAHTKRKVAASYFLLLSHSLSVSATKMKKRQAYASSIYVQSKISSPYLQRSQSCTPCAIARAIDAGPRSNKCLDRSVPHSNPAKCMSRITKEKTNSHRRLACQLPDTCYQRRRTLVDELYLKPFEICTAYFPRTREVHLHLQKIEC